MQTSAEFDVWWNENGVKSEIPVLAESYREIAWKAWQVSQERGWKEGTLIVVRQ